MAAGLGLWLATALPAAAALSQDEMRELEQLLAALGFDPGPIDGVADQQTAVAIEAYQSFAALRVDGVASEALLQELRGVRKSLGNLGEPAPAEAAPTTAAGNAAAVPPDDGNGGTSQSDQPLSAPLAEPAGGRRWDVAVHLASFRHASKALEEWQRLQGLMPNLMGDMTAVVRKIDLGGEGQYFRLYAGPFPNLATAQDFCAMIKQDGYDCGIARNVPLQIDGSAPMAPAAPVVSDGQDEEGQSQASGKAAAEPEVPPAEPAAAAAESDTALPAVAPEVSEAPPMPAEEPVTEEVSAPQATLGDEAPAVAEGAEVSAASPPPVMPAEPAVGDEAPAVAEGAEVSAASPPPPVMPAEPAVGDEGPAVAEGPEISATPPPPAVMPAEATKAPGPGARPPMALVTAALIGPPTPGEAPVPGVEEAPAEATSKGPTVLIPATGFGRAAAGESGAPAPEATGKSAAPAPEAAVSASADPTTIDTFLVETAMLADALPVSGPAAAEAAPRSEPLGRDGGAVESAPAVSGEAGSAGATAPGPQQTAVLVETGVEDYATATAAFEAGDCEAALRSYDVAFEKGGLPRRALADGYNNRGRCLYDLARYDEALADFDRAIGLDREFAAAYYNRGRVHNAMGDRTQARTDLKTAYDLGFGRLNPPE